MNLHAPQSVEAATELREIAAVPLQIVSPRESVPIVSVVQDTLVGANRFTRPNVLFTKKQAMNLLVHAKQWDGKLPPPVSTTPQPMWSGQQLLSALLPPVTLQMPNSTYRADRGDDENSQNFVKIFNGQIYQGILDKAVFSKQLLHIIYNDYGPEITVDFLDALQAMIASFLMNSGFSVGISDLIADEATNVEIDAALKKITKTVEDQILQLHTGLFENNSGRSNQEEFEGKLMSVLNKAVGEAGGIGLKSLADTNRMTNMIKAGSKGSDVNVSQMVATLGQQAIEGKRVPNGFQHRTLPHFKRFDDSAQARGFIPSSYIKGLQPDEFFFHAMTGREGLIDTAVKTADTGYMQRQIRVALEDLIVQHDGSVRDATGNVVQIAYGEDGMNATKLENQSLPLATMSEADIRAKFVADGAANAEQYIQDILEDRRVIVEKIFMSKPQKNVRYPVHMDRVIHAVKVLFNLKDNEGTVTAQQVLDAQAAILNRTHSRNRLWGALVRYYIAPLNLKNLGFTPVALDALTEQIILKHWKSWVEPGQPIGVIAAQSIGEPATQMSAVYSTKVTINGKNTKYSGSIGAYIDALIEKNKDDVKQIGNDSVVLDLDCGDEIIGVSNDEKTSWLPIKQVSRHPANGGLVEVRTRTGRSTTATLTHSFLKRTSMGIAPILGSDLKVGDRIPVAKQIPQIPNPVKSVVQGKSTFALDNEFGWLCGLYLADGSLNGNVVNISKVNPYVETSLRKYSQTLGINFTVKHSQGAYGPSKENQIHSKDMCDFLESTFKHGSFDKVIGGIVYHAPTEFIAGLIGGYFDGDGNISVERQHIRASSRSETLLKNINCLLGYCGLFGYMGRETSIRIPGAVQFTLTIPKSLIGEFYANIGLRLPEKAAALKDIANYKDRENKHSSQEMLDKIPECGELIAETGKLLELPGQSRTYGRWLKKESIGRETLRSYVQIFKGALANINDATIAAKVTANIHILESAAYSDVLWDEIVELVYSEDPHTYVYDFTVPGNDSFMVDDNIMVHNTLNTFHLAGVAAKSNMTRGVPRLKELMKVTKNPKAIELTIPLRRDLRSSKEEARRVSQELEFTLLQDLVTVARIYFDPRDSTTLVAEDADWLAYLAAYEQATKTPTTVVQSQDPLSAGANATAAPHAEAKKSPWILRFELDRERMFNKNITMDDIAFILKNKFSNELETQYSDYNSNRLVFRIRLAGQSDPIDDLTTLKMLQHKVLSATAVRGIPGLRSVNYQKISDIVELKDGKYKSVDQYILISDGSNFADVITHPDVDASRVVSSNVHDMFENLGIEATRATLFKEITTLFAESGSSVNYRHVCTLIDKMCHKGRTMSIDRYGINKNDIGPLAKMSFEQTEDIALRAAIFGERDPVLGVSAKVMLGAPIRAGTGFSELIYDELAAIKLAESTPEQIRRGPMGPQVYTESELDDALYGDVDRTVCATTMNELQLNVAIPAARLQTVEEEIADVDIAIIE